MLLFSLVVLGSRDGARLPNQCVLRVRIPDAAWHVFEFFFLFDPYSEDFSPDNPVTKINNCKFQFDQETVDKEPLCGCASANSHFILFYFILPVLFTQLLGHHLFSLGLDKYDFW